MFHVEEVICAIIKEHVSNVLWGQFFMSTQESVNEFVTSGSVRVYTLALS